jgi:large subunit ribosomal protein L24
MPGVNIKKDDTVRVMTGKDRGKQGRVIHVQPREGRIMVDGVGRAKKATRATGARGKKGQQLSQGGIIDTELFIDLSNVMLVCKTCGKATRIGHRRDEGVPVRVCRRCDGEA